MSCIPKSWPLLRHSLVNCSQDQYCFTAGLEVVEIWLNLWILMRCVNTWQTTALWESLSSLRWGSCLWPYCSFRGKSIKPIQVKLLHLGHSNCTGSCFACWEEINTMYPSFWAYENELRVLRPLHTWLSELMSLYMGTTPWHLVGKSFLLWGLLQLWAIYS